MLIRVSVFCKKKTQTEVWNIIGLERERERERKRREEGRGGEEKREEGKIIYRYRF